MTIPADPHSPGHGTHRQGGGLAAAAAEILHDIEQTFSPRAARPRPVRGVLRIGAHTYVEYVMMPSLLARLQQQAPNLRIHMVPLNADYESQLDEGVISMVISKQDEVPGRFRRIPLFEDKLICAAHRSHPLQGQVLCIESFAQAQHLLVAPRGSEGASSMICWPPTA